MGRKKKPYWKGRNEDHIIFRWPNCVYNKESKINDKLLVLVSEFKEVDRHLIDIKSAVLL